MYAIFSLNMESGGPRLPDLGLLNHALHHMVFTPFTKLLKKNICLLLIIKIKHKKIFFLSPLTIGQSVRPPNIQINNHF